MSFNKLLSNNCSLRTSNAFEMFINQSFPSTIVGKGSVLAVPYMVKIKGYCSWIFFRHRGFIQDFFCMEGRERERGGGGGGGLSHHRWHQCSLQLFESLRLL